MYHGLMASGDTTREGEGDLSSQLDLESDLNLQQVLTARMLIVLKERRDFLVREANASLRERRGFNWGRFVPSLSSTTEGLVRSWENSDPSRGFGAGDVLEEREDNFYERLVQTDLSFRRRRVLGARALQIWRALDTAGDAITAAEVKLTVGVDGVETFQRWSLSGEGERERERRLFAGISASEEEVSSSGPDQHTKGNVAARETGMFGQLIQVLLSERDECYVPSGGWDVGSCWRCPSQCWQAVMQSHK